MTTTNEQVRPPTVLELGAAKARAAKVRIAKRRMDTQAIYIKKAKENAAAADRYLNIVADMHSVSERLLEQIVDQPTPATPATQPNRYNELSEGQQHAIDKLINHIAGAPTSYESAPGQEDGHKLSHVLLKAYIYPWTA